MHEKTDLSIIFYWTDSNMNSVPVERKYPFRIEGYLAQVAVSYTLDEVVTPILNIVVELIRINMLLHCTILILSPPKDEFLVDKAQFVP